MHISLSSRVDSTEFPDSFIYPSLSTASPGRSSNLNFLSAKSWSKSFLVGQQQHVYERISQAFSIKKYLEKGGDEIEG